MGQKQYYAIFKGPHVDEPTIYTSWGTAHPYVIGCNAIQSGHPTLNEAKAWLKEMGAQGEPRLVGEAPVVRGTKILNGFYAVAYGADVGVYEFYYGKNGAQSEVNQVPNACYKHFQTKVQARAFIKDWNESVADIYRREIKKELDARDVKPPYLGSNVAQLFDTEPPPVKKEDEEEAEGEVGDNRAAADTLAEAWKNCIADMYREEIKRQLDKGARPPDLKFDVTSLFQASTSDGEDCHGVGSLKLNELKIE